MSPHRRSWLRLPRRSSRGRAVVIGLLVSLIASLVGGLNYAPSTLATTSSGASLHLISQMHYVAGDEESLFRLSFSVDRASAAPIQVPSVLVISSHRTVNTREEVREAIAGDLPRLIDTVRIDLSDRIGVQGGPVDVLIGTEVASRTANLLQFPEAGLYPLMVSWEEDGVTTSTLTTFIERLPSGVFSPQEKSGLGNDTLRIALLGTIDSAITLQPNSTTDINSADRQALNDVISVVETLPEVPITLALRPELVEALDRSTAEDADLLARMQASSSLRILSNTFVDVDPSESSIFDNSAIFRRQLRLGEDVLTSLLPTHINPRLAWFQLRQLTNGGGLLLAELGLRNVILGPEAQQTTADGATLFTDTTRKIELRLSDESSVTAGLIDRYLSESLTRGSLSGKDSFALTAQHIIAELKALLFEFDQRNDSLAGRGVLLSTNDGSLPSLDMVTALFRVLSDDPRFSVERAESLIATMSVNLVDGRPVVVDLPASETLSNPNAASTMANLTATVNAYSSMLPQGDLRPRLWRRLLDVFPHRAFDDQRRVQYASIITEETEALAEAIVPPMATTFTLGGRDSVIRFSVRNDGDADVRVRIRLTSSKLSLPEGEKIVLVPARASTAVDIPVIARSNGRFPVTLQMFTPEGGVAISPESVLTARVNALAGLGQLVTGIALLLLMSWWASHIRRTRHRRHTSQARKSHRHPSVSGS